MGLPLYGVSRALSVLPRRRQRRPRQCGKSRPRVTESIGSDAATQGGREGGRKALSPSLFPPLSLSIFLLPLSLSRYIESGVYNPIWPADKLPPDDGRAR